MTITLCEDCFKGHTTEIVGIPAFAPCAHCGKRDGRAIMPRGSARCHVYRRDPRRKDVPMVETADPPPTIEASAFEIAMRGLAIIRDGAGKTTDLGDGEGPVLLDVEAIIDLADSFIALAIKVARDARPGAFADPPRWRQAGR